MDNRQIGSKQLAIDEKINYIWRTDDYGRAEFTICPIFKRRKIVKCYIYPRQQPSAENYFIIDNEFGWDGLDFGCLLCGSKLIRPSVWLTTFCKEHKTHSFDIYVPENSKSLSFSTSLGRLAFNWF